MKYILLIVGAAGMLGFGFKALDAASHLVMTGTIGVATAWITAFAASALVVLAGIGVDFAEAFNTIPSQDKS